MEQYVGLEHLDPDSLRIRRWGSPSDVEAGKLFFKIGDIIFAKRRAYQHKLGVAEFDGICSAHAMGLRVKPEVLLPEFLPFFMQSDLFMTQAVAISVGSLSPTINGKTMAVQEFALPPIEEQQRALELLEAIEDQVENLASAVISSQNPRRSMRPTVRSWSHSKVQGCTRCGAQQVRWRDPYDPMKPEIKKGDFYALSPIPDAPRLALISRACTFFHLLEHLK